MEILKYIIPILVGALIGYCTNYIAIKMLFRPYTEKILFGIRLPFTPGVIPKNKPRMAAAVGKAVGENLFTGNDIARISSPFRLPDFKRVSSSSAFLK